MSLLVFLPLLSSILQDLDHKFPREHEKGAMFIVPEAEDTTSRTIILEQLMWKIVCFFVEILQMCGIVLADEYSF